MSFIELSRARGQRTLVAGVSGLVFGLGLILSGMTNPARVVAFLDVAGDWNPALAFVMMGAVLVAAPAFALARRHPVALLGGPIRLPDRFRLDLRLVGGAIVFGIGWGLTGICPGPGILLIATLHPEALLFGAAVVGGMAIANRLLRSKPDEAS
jgi:uncharacterized membrane protein YedE/YeeE